MQVEHNGETWQVERGVHRTLGELLDACLADDPAERCWVRVHVDGREIPEHDWAALRERSCDDVGRVRLESRTLAEAARASLAHARDYCTPVEAAIAAVAAGLRAGRREDAMATYAHLLDAFGVLAGTLAAVGHVLATEHGDDAARELARCEDELLPWLEMLLEAQQGDDDLGIADTLEYEVAPLVRAWAERVKAVEAH